MAPRDVPLSRSRGMSRQPGSMIARVRLRWFGEVRQISTIGASRTLCFGKAAAANPAFRWGTQQVGGSSRTINRAYYCSAECLDIPNQVVYLRTGQGEVRHSTVRMRQESANFIGGQMMRDRPEARWTLLHGAGWTPRRPHGNWRTIAGRAGLRERHRHWQSLRADRSPQPRQFAVTIAVRSWWLSDLRRGRTH